MIEQWSQEQINALISVDEFYKIGIFLSIQPNPIGMTVHSTNAKGNDVEWTVKEYSWIPAESMHATLALKGKNLFIQGRGDQDGIKVQQTFHRRRMVPVDDYVDAKTLREDPGVSTLFG